jgi:hypothetical protein
VFERRLLCCGAPFLGQLRGRGTDEFLVSGHALFELGDERVVCLAEGLLRGA